jgi:hypothetical protein
MGLFQVRARAVDDDGRAAGEPGVDFDADAVVQAMAAPAQREAAQRGAAEEFFVRQAQPANSIGCPAREWLFLVWR